MPKDNQSTYLKERSVIAVLLVLTLFLSPMTEFWAALQAPWYSPYLVWVLAIFIAWWLQHYLKQDAD